MKKTKFYICPDCGNILTSLTEASVSCCGKKLEGQSPKKADSEEKLNVEMIENDYFVTSDHPMTKDHYITFAALLTGDSLILRKQYPEWDLQARIPRIGRGMLVWACNQHGLFYQLV